MDDVAGLGHANLIAFSREAATWGAEGRFVDDDGILVFTTGSWIPVNLNGAFRWSDQVSPGRLLQRAREFFGEVGRGYSVKVRDTGADEDLRSACQDAGLARFGDSAPEMVLLDRLPDAAPPDGTEIRVVSDTREAADFAQVNAQAYATYGMPEDQPRVAFSRPEAMLACHDAVSVVAYRDGAPVAAAQSYLSHGIGGIYWVGTVPAERGRGLGEAVTRTAGNLAFDRGAGVVTLQASPMGAPVYRRMGYREIYRYEEYVSWTPPER